MPELPEVETTCRGIKPFVQSQLIEKLIVRESRLRWPVDKGLVNILPGQIVAKVSRRGKYILLQLQTGTLIIHLGMSGHLRIVDQHTPIKKHDHIDLIFKNHYCLRLNDPRRFGAWLWSSVDLTQHRLLNKLGVEPLSKKFCAEYLFQQGRQRSISIKQFIMDSHIVVGVGNIYANEVLFKAGIHPQKCCSDLQYVNYVRLVDAIKIILKAAIRLGGTTLRDFARADGKPGYFSQNLLVYGRDSQPCVHCGDLINICVIAQRRCFFCSKCQK